MCPTETHNDLAIRRYSVVFVAIAFAAVFMPTKFFWLLPMDNVTQPWFGYGRDAARIDPFSFQFVKAQAHYPHNFILQLWLELGILGIILFVWFLGSILRTIQKMNSQRRLYAFGAFFCAISPITFTYNLWSSWVIALLCMITWLFFLFGHETKTISTSTQ